MLSPIYGQLSPLRVPTKAVRVVQDTDAIAYIAAVETADGQSLESVVKYAYEDFILGCKADGTWSAIKASCILAGARTLNGALVPLVGTAPTNNNFVSGDYNRAAGLVGNGSTKYLNSNRNNNADPQNDRHLSTYVHTAHTAGTGGVYAGVGGGQSGANHFGRRGVAPADLFARSVSTTFDSITGQGGATGFLAMRRRTSSAFDFRVSNTTTNFSRTSEVPFSATTHIFQANPDINRTNARLSFYSVGESLDLAALDTRVSTLMTDLAAAIP